MTDSGISKNHPRFRSLKIRNDLSDFYNKGIISDFGLIAHGRGEAFDYLIGEKTIDLALQTIRVATAQLIVSNSVISINGNTAALESKNLVKLSNLTNSKLEINLFHKTKKRATQISRLLKDHGAEIVYGTNDDYLTTIPSLRSNRKFIDKRGIYQADVVFVPLEDGDRTEFLKKMGKIVITIDLNPLSRTATMSDINIIDNLVRVIPEMIKQSRKMLKYSDSDLKKIIKKFDNQKQLNLTLRYMSKRLIDLTKKQ